MKQNIITMAFVAMAAIGAMSLVTTTAVFAQTNGNPHDSGEAGNPHDLPNCSGNPHVEAHFEHHDEPGSPGCPGAQ
jgi:hypothetical protein